MNGFFFLSSLSPGQKIMTILFRKPPTCSLEQIITRYFTWKHLKAIAVSGEHRAEFPSEFSPSEVSWMPDFSVPIIAVVQRKRLSGHTLLSVQLHPIVSEKEASQSLR